MDLSFPVPKHLKSFIKRLCDGVFDRPSLQYPPQQCPSRHSDPSGPFLNSQSLPVEFKPPLVSPVLALFHSSLPLTILWIVVACVHFPAQLVLISGPWPHIPQEIRETIPTPPLLAHRNPYSSVPFVPVILGVVASHDHSLPDNPFRSASFAVSGVSSSPPGKFLSFNTATAVDVLSEIARYRLVQRTAITKTEPHSWVGSRNVVQCHRPTKPFVC